MGQLVYVGSPSANFVDSWRYEPGRLVGELDGNIFRMEIRDAVSVFAHISNIRLRTASQAKPFEITQAQDVENPVDTQQVTCGCCDMSTIYYLSSVTIFKHFMIIKDSSNRDHWIDLATGTDWTKIDLCYASASRRSNFYRTIRIIDVELPIPTVSQLVHRLRQLARVGKILLTATTDFVHQSNAAYILNMLDSFAEAFKVTDVPSLDCIRAKPWISIDATLHELNLLYSWPQVGHVSAFFYIEFDFPLCLNFDDATATRRYEDRILRRFWSVLSASRTFLRCADKRIKWSIALVAKLHRVPAGEAAERIANRLLKVLPHLERIPGDTFGDNDERTIMDDSYAQRGPETYAQNHHKLRQRLIFSTNSSAHTFIYEENALASREEQYRNALRYQNVYGT